MDNYKGYYHNNKVNEKKKFYEFGAHFKYSELYKILVSIAKIREIGKSEDKKNKNYFENDFRSISIGNINKSRNNHQNDIQSLTQRNTDNSKKVNFRLSISKNKNMINLSNENLNKKISFDFSKKNKDKPIIYQYSDNNIDNDNNLNINDNLNKMNIKSNKNGNSNINLINNLPMLNINNLTKHSNNPIQIIINNKNNEVKSRNYHINKKNSFREINNTFAKKYINPLNKITQFRIKSPINNDTLLLSSRNKVLKKPNKINSRSISITGNNLIDENSKIKNNNNTILGYKFKNKIKLSDRPKLLITNKSNYTKI